MSKQKKIAIIFLILISTILYTAFLPKTGTVENGEGKNILQNDALPQPSADTSGWEIQTSGTTYDLKDIDMVDNLIGWCVGNRTILYTENGGSTWAIQTGGADQEFWCIDAVNSNIAFAGGVQSLLKTINKGYTWTSVKSGWFISVRMYNETLGWASTFMDMYRTSDGGSNWQLIKSNFPARKLVVIDANTIWALLTNSSVSISTNGGISWSKPNSIDPNYSFISIVALNSTTAWTVGCYTATETIKNDTIAKTTNGGTSFISQVLPYYDFWGMDFLNELIGWVVGDNGYVYNTTDGGSSWKKQITPTTKSLNDIYMIDSLNGWSVGDGGIIIHTSNGGKSIPSSTTTPTTTSTPPASLEYITIFLLIAAGLLIFGVFYSIQKKKNAPRAKTYNHNFAHTPVQPPQQFTVSSPAEFPEPIYEPTIRTNNPETLIQKKFCDNCGKPIPPIQPKFCPFCGKEF